MASEAQIAEFREAFNYFDEDRDGMLNADEVVTVRDHAFLPSPSPPHLHCYCANQSNVVNQSRFHFKLCHALSHCIPVHNST